MIEKNEVLPLLVGVVVIALVVWLAWDAGAAIRGADVPWGVVSVWLLLR